MVVFIIVLVVLICLLYEDRKSDNYGCKMFCIIIFAVLCMSMFICRMISCEQEIKSERKLALISKNYIMANDVTIDNLDEYKYCTDRIRLYNKDITTFKKLSKSVWVGWFFCDAAEEFEVIEL